MDMIIRLLYSSSLISPYTFVDGGCSRRLTLPGRGNSGGKARLESLVDNLTVVVSTVTVEAAAALAEGKILLGTSYLRILPASR